jgi:hypothetical protein
MGYRGSGYLKHDLRAGRMRRVLGDIVWRGKIGHRLMEVFLENNIRNLRSFDISATYPKNSSVFVYLTILGIEFHGVREHKFYVFTKVYGCVIFLTFQTFLWI